MSNEIEEARESVYELCEKYSTDRYDSEVTHLVTLKTQIEKLLLLVNGELDG